MSAHCGHHEPGFDGANPAYRRALIAVIFLNAAMFFIEMPMGFVGQSEALKADALDFFADSLTYGLSLWVIGRPLALRAKVAILKGVSMLALGLWVLGSTLYRFIVETDPVAEIMGSIGFMALLVNLISVLLLMRFAKGDANVRSVWLCSRNDAIGNVAVIVAASGVWFTGSALPDLIVAGIMATLFVSGAVAVLRQARRELKLADRGPTHG